MEFDGEYPLHYCAFKGLPEFEKILNESGSELINSVDKYGNTPLHIAAMLRDEKIVSLLLRMDCDLTMRNESGWRQIDELVATGSDYLAREGYRRFRAKLSANGQGAIISQKLRAIPDCILEFRWEFRTWIPFVARHLPSDNCKLFKKDNLLRLDTTLLDFKNRDWVRGQLSIIVDCNKPFESRICLIDHQHRSFQILDGTMMRENSDDWLDETVQTSLHMPIVRMHMDFSNINCRRETSRLPWRKDSNNEVQIGEYNTQTYTVNHMKIFVKKRSEHLLKEDLRFLSTLHSHIKQGTVSNAVKLVQDRTNGLGEVSKENYKPLRRLTPRVTWEQYRSWNLQGNDLYIGLKPVLKTQTNEVKLTVAMTDQIDFKITFLLDMFKCFSPLRKFTKLDESLLASLPPGFPVRVDVPVSPGITGRVTFTNVEKCQPNTPSKSGIILADQLFRIPVGYTCSQVL